MYAVGVCVCSRLVVFVICSVKVKNIKWSCKVGAAIQPVLLIAQSLTFFIFHFFPLINGFNV